MTVDPLPQADAIDFVDRVEQLSLQPDGTLGVCLVEAADSGESSEAPTAVAAGGSEAGDLTSTIATRRSGSSSFR